MDDMRKLKGLLFTELENLTRQNFKDETGKIDKEQAETAFKRIEAINNIADNITQAHREQLDAVKTLINAGYGIKVPEALGIEVANNRQIESK